MGSGEIPNELGDSWFSPEIALGLASTLEILGGRALLKRRTKNGLLSAFGEKSRYRPVKPQSD